MCFSATASFVAGGALSAAGVLTVSKAKKPGELPLASIPLLFGLQQCIDGVVWISLNIPLLNITATYIYGLFAFVLWPLFVPLALIPIEPDRVRKKILKALSLIGIGVGSFFLYFIFLGGVTSHILNYCVAYDTPHPYRISSLAFYLIATAGPFLVSSKKLLNIFGIVLFVSFAIAGWFYIETLSSVWCFFAAVLSSIIYWYFRDAASPA
jgi:hypothetical protein